MEDAPDGGDAEGLEPMSMLGRLLLRTTPLALVLACQPSSTSKDAPAAAAPSAAPSTSPDAAPAEPYRFDCADGRVRHGLGYGAYESQSSAWEPAAPGTSNAAAADVLCSRMTEIDGCVAREKAERDGGADTVDLVLSIGRGRVGVGSAPDGGASAELARCVETALAGASFGAEGKLRYRYILDIARGRPGSAREPHPLLTETSVTGTGTLPLDLVTRVVRSSTPRLRRCLAATVDAGRQTAGSVRVSLAIDAAGATRAKSESGTLADETARACVVDVLGRLKFPGSEGATKAVAEISFDVAQ